MKVNELANRLAGYAYLIEVFQIKNMPIHHQSMISQSNQGATIKTLENGRIVDLPNHLMSLLLKVCSHHGDQEVAQIEDVLRQNHIIVCEY